MTLASLLKKTGVKASFLCKKLKIKECELSILKKHETNLFKAKKFLETLL